MLASIGLHWPPLVERENKSEYKHSLHLHHLSFSTFFVTFHDHDLLAQLGHNIYVYFKAVVIHDKLRLSQH